MAPLKPELGTVSNYTLGLVRVASPGQVMVERTEGAEVLPGFALEKPIRVRHLGHHPSEATGGWMARFEYKGTCPSGRYVVTNPNFHRARLGIVVSEDGTIACPQPVMQLGGAKKGRSWDLEEALPIQPFRPMPVVAKLFPGVVRWELVFRGYANGKLTLEYREYPGDFRRKQLRAGLERVAFDLPSTPTSVKTLIFDEAREKPISYRGVTMEVVNVASEQIVFRVVSDPPPDKQ